MRATIRASGLVGPLATACLVAALSGCRTAIALRHFPDFYDPDLKAVAIVPLANQSLHPRAGEFLTDRLVAAMKANGTYTVAGPRDLEAPLKQAGLSMPAAGDCTAAAEVFRKLGGFQAVLTGTVKTLSAHTGTYVDVDPYYLGYYHYGRHRWGHWGYWGYPMYRVYGYSRACAAAEASLVRVADGQVIHATPGVLAADFSSTNGPPRLPDEALAEAADALVRKLLAEFAVVPRQVRVDADETLWTAARRGGGWTPADRFGPDDGELAVFVSLPAEAARNSFRLTVAKPGREDVLADELFTWQRGEHSRQFIFSPAQLAQVAGTGRFRLGLYCEGRLSLRRDFRIGK